MSKAGVTIPIFAYHRVLPDSASDRSPFTVSETQFKQQMTLLAENGYDVVMLPKILERIATAQNDTNGTHGAAKAVAITFDDGYRDNFDVAFPVLSRFGFTATFFVITEKIGTPEFMSWEQLTELQQQHMAIESHGHTHTPLELLPQSNITDEVTRSKLLLEQKLNKDVNFISFPHGSYNESILNEVREAGYLACGTSHLGYATKSSDAFELPRILIRNTHTISQFEAFCQAASFSLLKAQALYATKNAFKNLIGLQRYQRLHDFYYRIRRENTSTGSEVS